MTDSTRSDPSHSSSRYVAPSLALGPRTLVWGARTYIVGVINTSPESFSGDGISSIDDAVERARRFIAEGADILDIGGQSTRPAPNKVDDGFEELTPEEEIRRVAPLIERLARVLPDAAISVDTYKPDVARAALEAGAHLLNDIYGFRRDPSLAAIAAEFGVPAIVMHNQRLARTPGDVIGAIARGFESSLAIAAAAGVGRERLIVDPGFGFGWTPGRNIEVLRRLRELTDLGLPLLVGTSRKSTIGAILGGAPVGERVFGTAATVAIAIAGGADLVRVHDVAEMKQVALVADAIMREDRGER